MKAHLVRAKRLASLVGLGKELIDLLVGFSRFGFSNTNLVVAMLLVFIFTSLEFLFPFMWYHSKVNPDSLTRVV
jgi:hypothetical protein